MYTSVLVRVNSPQQPPERREPSRSHCLVYTRPVEFSSRFCLILSRSVTLRAKTAKALDSRDRPLKMCDDTVRVALRIRPLVESELEKGCQACLDTIPGEHQVRICNTDKAFTYNYVFPPHVGQEDFYNTAIKRLVDNTFQGYNVTILAYGQTGSGKTHSMGTNYTGVGEKGIIPRVIYDIFDIIESKEDWNFKVAVSFMELYQEQLYDLLSDKQKSQSIVDIREDGKSIRIVGVTEKQVANAQETLECLAQGSMGRVTGATAMNAHSSRSHAIFTLCIRQQKSDDPNTATVAKLHLVDLAGSERSKKTQATGERFKEGVNINKGLLALGNVISQLGDGASGTYIGYRDSKLTRLLQDSLGGNSMTLMVACVSPADYNLDETLSTLRYADRARKIKNKPIVNQDPKVAEINRLNKLVQELRLALMSQELGITCPKEHEALEEKYRVLQHKLRDMTEKLNLNLGEIVIMHERAEMAEQAREKIRIAMALLLDEFKQVLQDFDTCSEIDNEKRNKLEAIYQRMLNIQNDERKASEELINHEISDSKNCVSHVAEDVAERVRAEESNNVEDSLDYFDKKEEEHTLRQAERNNEVQNINKELALKESFVSELIKSATQETAESRKNIIEMEQESKRLHAEKEEHLQAVHAHNVSSKENMTSNYHSSHCENDVRYPYTDRVAVGEDYVDFIYQFVKDSNISTKDCKNAASISNIRNNIIGTPSNFPSHEDFLLETYNFDISISPWQKQVPYAAYAYVPKYLKDFYFDHIDLEFHEAVYPIRISIYEVYMKNNFGNVIEVWAQDSEDEDRWILLWNQSLFKFHEVCRLTERRRWGSRIFSPPLRSSNFKTKMLRLQFISNSCTQLDAVMLIGTSKLIFPKNPEDESITNLLHRIRKQRHSCSKRFCSSHSKDCSRIQQELYYTTHDYENAYLDIIDLQMEFSYYCIICKSDIATSFHKLAHKQVFREEDVSSSRQGYVNHPLLRNHWNYVKFIEDIKLSSGESKEQEDSFFALPDEIIRIILKYLDMRSFCRMSKVNKRFNNLTQDSSLFKCLNLRNLKKEYSKDSYFCYDKILSYFASKCTDLRQLDLTASCISEPDFVNFLQSCGHCLTHLRLSSCEFVGKLSLLKISEICKNLKVFDLSYCVALGKMDQEFSSLENLEFLENLDFGESDVKRTESLCKILQKTRRMRDLNLSSCYWDNFEPLHVDVITIQLKNSCPDLEIIDLSGNIITSRGIHALAECKNLRKLSMKNVNINEDCTIVKHSLHRLFSSCQCLEEVNLMDLDYRDGSSINENVYEGLTLCKNLRQLYLWDTDSFAILEQCPKLQTIYVRKWWKFDDHVHMRDDIAQAKEKYPHVSILEYQKGTSDAVDEEWLEM